MDRPQTVDTDTVPPAIQQWLAKKGYEFDLDLLRVAPANYRFFRSGEVVCFGLKEQADRMNAGDGYEPWQMLFWDLTGGEFADEETAAWLAETLNRATGRLDENAHLSAAAEATS